ncbi:hypothetical protein A7W90_16135 [Clostridium sp. Bc-iso-3]|nr:hypothetical protein A7W90_16135 [Clostridium sp. Bc-iso-3]
MKNSKSKLLGVVRKMPPLQHSISGKAFDIKKSKAIQWLIDQPDILNWLWNRAKLECIYNPDTGEWQGADYED